MSKNSQIKLTVLEETFRLQLRFVLFKCLYGFKLHTVISWTYGFCYARLQLHSCHREHDKVTDGVRKQVRFTSLMLMLMAGTAGDEFSLHLRWQTPHPWRLHIISLEGKFDLMSRGSAAARKISFDVFPTFFPSHSCSVLYFLLKLWLVPLAPLSLSSPLPKQCAISQHPGTINTLFSTTTNSNFTLEFDTMD